MAKYLQFAVENQQAKLTKCDPRPATKGDREQVNTYLHLQMTMYNGVLSYFHSQLRAALFDKAETKDLDAEHRPNSKFPQMGRIKWDWECGGYGLQVHVGGSGHSDIRADVEMLDNFDFQALEGGSVTIRCRAKTSVGDSERGRLTGMVGKTIEISLLPPGEDYVAPEAPPKGRKGKKASEATADDKQQELEPAAA